MYKNIDDEINAMTLTFILNRLQMFCLLSFHYFDGFLPFFKIEVASIRNIDGRAQLSENLLLT